MSPAAQARRVKALLRELERLRAAVRVHDGLRVREGSVRALRRRQLGLPRRRSASDATTWSGATTMRVFSPDEAREQQAREHLVQLSGQAIENETSLPFNGQARERHRAAVPWRDAVGRR